MKNQAFNPYLPSWEYIPDAEPHVFGDRVYIYGSHDRFDGDLFCQNDYVCWSAPVDDLGSWRFEGVIYRKTQDPLNPGGERCMYAPDVARGPDGRYYLYYALDFLSVMAVAACDSPAGEYAFLGFVHRPGEDRLWSEAGDPFLYDPGVFVDDDGRIYLYSGFSPVGGNALKKIEGRGRTHQGGWVIELEADMLSVRGEPKLIFPRSGDAAGTSFQGHEFFEASSMRKIGSTYYFIYSSVAGHELCYATSARPDGGFRYGGTLVSNGDLFLNGFSDDDRAMNYVGTNHGSLVEIRERWYVFYHRQTNRHPFSRQAMAEAVELRPDGSIAQAELTSCGLNGGPLRGRGTYEARIACHLMSAEGAGRYGFGDYNRRYDSHPCFTQDGADREGAGDQHIANFGEGCLAGFRYFQLEGLERLGVRVRGTGRGSVTVRLSPQGPVRARIPVAPGPDWTEFHGPCRLDDGKQALYLGFEGEGRIDILDFTLE